MSGLSQELRELQMKASPGGEDLFIESISGNEALGKPFDYSVIAVAEKDGFSFNELIGTGVTVNLKLRTEGAEVERYFHGYVATISHLGYDAVGHSRYSLGLVPWLWFLTQSTNCRIFQQQTVPEILESVFSSYPNASLELKLSGSYPMRDYCVQYRETDFNFVQRLMEHEGIYYTWVHQDGIHTMVICDTMTAHEAVPGFGELLYRAGGGIKDKDHLSSWKVQQVVTPGSYTLNSFNFESPNPSPNTKLLSKDDKDHDYPGGNLPIYQYTGDYLDRGEGERIALIRREEAQTDARTVVASTNARGLTCGSILIPREVPRTDQSGLEFLITATSFRASAGNFGTGTGGGEEGYQCTFNALPVADGIFRPKRLARIPRMQGLQTAIVTGPPDEEIYVDNYGRVKVQFHWDQDGQYDDGTSCWIRVSQAWAGAGWGGMAIPRIGQEVLVDFVEGDPDQPIITGRVYNGDHPVPYELPKEKTKTTFKSNSTPDGGKGHNEWRFEDKKGKEQIYIHAQKDMDVRVRNNLRETTYGNRHEKTGWYKAEGDNGGKRYVTDNSERHELIMDKSLIEVGEVVNVIHHKDLLSYHEKNRLEFARESYRMSSEGPMVMETTANIGIKAQTDLKLQGLSAVHIGGNAVTVDGHSLTLRGGGAFIKLDPSGITMQGVMVKVNSGGASQGAQAPESNDNFTPEQPVPAASAVESFGGGTRRYQGGGRRSPFPPPGGWGNADDYQPLPDNPPPPPPGPPPPPPPPIPEEQSDRPCGIESLEVQCSHGSRKANPYLAVVATPNLQSVERITYNVGPNFSLGISETKQYGGTDSIKAKAKTIEGGSEQLAMEDSQSPASANYSAGAEKTFALAELRSNGGGGSEPNVRTKFVYAKGCDEVYREVQVYQLPSDYITGSFEISGFAAIIDEINDKLKELCKDFMKGPFALVPRIVPPKGTFSLSSGWKEDGGSHKAYYEKAVTAALNPLGGFSISAEASLAELGGAAALGAIGIVPPLSTVIMDVATDYLGDLVFGLRITCTLVLSATLAKKEYYLGGEGMEASGGPTGQVRIGPFLNGRLGAADGFRLEIEGSAETGIDLSGRVSFDGDDLKLSMGLACAGVTLKVNVVARTGYWDPEEEYSWNLFDAFDLLGPKSFTLYTFR